MDELRTRADNSAAVPAVNERVTVTRPLSSEQAAALLGVKPYTVNEWARLGRIRAWKDSKRGPWHFEPADVAAYKAEHMCGRLQGVLAAAYSSGDDDTRPLENASPRARANTSATRASPRHNPQHGRPVGTRRASRRPAGTSRPYAPGSHAWRPPEKPPEG